MDNNTKNVSKESFSQYLFKIGVSKLSYKNYKSDLNHFASWIKLKLKSFGVAANTLDDCFPYLNAKVAIEYKDFLIANKVQSKTVNRRMSTLRHLSRYLVSNMMLSINFMEGIQNISTYVPKKEKVFKIKATSPYFGKHSVSVGTSSVIIDFDKPLQGTSLINIWVTDSPK